MARSTRSDVLHDLSGQWSARRTLSPNQACASETPVSRTGISTQAERRRGSCRIADQYASSSLLPLRPSVPTLKLDPIEIVCGRSPLLHRGRDFYIEEEIEQKQGKTAKREGGCERQVAIAQGRKDLEGSVTWHLGDLGLNSLFGSPYVCGEF